MADPLKDTGIKSLAKALKILKLFQPARPEWTAREIEEVLGYHKSSVQRLVGTLEKEGFLERYEGNRGGYRLGPQMIYLSNVALQGADLRRLARPTLEKMVQLTKETAHLCVVDQSQCYYLDKIDSPRSIRIVTHIGQRLHLHCTGVGKALLSGMSTAEVDRVITERGLPGFTPQTITSRDRLLEELQRIRVTGISIDNEEFEIGLKCLAAPIFDSKGSVIAAMSFSGPSQRLTPETLQRYTAYIKEAALEVSMKLGYHLQPSQSEKSAAS
jgi:IclR family transcriptional regulator, KDG regulon repressor